jgi:DNA-binding NtrC family response regulator
MSTRDAVPSSLPRPGVAEVRVLQRISSEIIGSLSLAQIYRVALDTMAELFAFHHSLILVVDDSGRYLNVVASRGYEGYSIGGRVPVGTGVIGVVAKKRRPMHWNHVGRHRAYISAQRRAMEEAGMSAELGDYVPVPGLPNAQSQIAIPLLTRDTLIGVLSVESPEPQAFTEYDRDLVVIVANQTASAIQSARLVEELQRANQSLEHRVRERTSELERELRVARETRHHARTRLEAALLGTSAKARALQDGVRRHAGSAAPLLLVGPPGAGKEAAARAIHDESDRRSGPFLHVSCPQIRTGGSRALFDSLATRTMHPIGTSPDSESRNSPMGGAPSMGNGPTRLVEEGSMLANAHGGTLFLEEVSELPTERHSDFRFLLTEMADARNAGTVFFPDVRVIASTSRDLWQEAQAGRFDLELCRMLAHETLAVPGLAERLEDLPPIVEHLIRWHARQLGKEVEGVAEDSMKRLLAYRWPGNVRELANLVERAVLVARGPVLEIDEDLLGEGIALGSYRLIERIGSGGMGEVWLGRHRLLARPAAVKIIREAALDAFGPDVEKRFRREAQATAELTSPHTVQLYDYGVADSRTCYYVMELLVGLDLQEMVERFGPLPAERAVALLRQACLSLNEAHGRGLVHRDIKPANLFVTSLGGEHDFLKVLDFGMVKSHKDAEATLLTAPGRIQGTPAFMAPELALGHEFDGRTDLYSLGCSAYWMLTGKPVFEGTTSAQMLHHVQTRPPRPSVASGITIPQTLEDVVLRCLEKNPADRPASAEELRRLLGAVRFTEPWSEERAAAWWRDYKPSRT